jgi:hypothetical protein
MVLYHLVLSRRRAWRGSVAAICWLRLLKLDAALLVVIVGICTTVVVVAIVASAVGVRVWRCRVRGSGLWVLLVGVVGLRIGGSGGPTGAVEGLATSLATTTCSDTAAEEEES